MTNESPPRQDARDLQAKLYREIGISAVAAALRFTTQPDPVSNPAPAVDKAVQAPQMAQARAA